MIVSTIDFTVKKQQYTSWGTENQWYLYIYMSTSGKTKPITIEIDEVITYAPERISLFLTRINLIKYGSNSCLGSLYLKSSQVHSVQCTMALLVAKVYIN